MFRLQISVLALVAVALTAISSFAEDRKLGFISRSFMNGAPSNGIPVQAGRFNGTFAPSPPGATYFNSSSAYYGASGPEFGRFFDGRTGKEYHIYQNTAHPSKPYLRCAGEDCMMMTGEEFREIMRQAEKGQKEGSGESSTSKGKEHLVHGAPMQGTTPTPTPKPSPTVAEGDCPYCDDGTGPGGHGDCPHCKGDGYLGKDDIKAINSSNGGASPDSSGGGTPDSGGDSSGGGGDSGGGSGGGGGGSGGGGGGSGGGGMESLLPALMNSMQQQQQQQQQEAQRQQELQRQEEARRAEEERLRREGTATPTGGNPSSATGNSTSTGSDTGTTTQTTSKRGPSKGPEEASYEKLFPKLELKP